MNNPLNYKKKEKIRNFFFSKSIQKTKNDIFFKKFYPLIYPNIQTIVLEEICRIINKYFKITNSTFDKDSQNNLNNLKNRPHNKYPLIFSYIFQFLKISERNNKIRFFLKENDAICFQWCGLTQAFAENSKLKIYISRHNEWFNKINKPQDNYEFDVMIKWIYKEAINILKLFNIKATVNDRGHLHETIFFVVNWFIDQLNCLENKRIPKIFVSGSVGAAFNRLMAFKVKENGGKVIVMDHGCGVGLWKNNYRGFFEFDWADSFITFGPEMAKGAEKNSLNNNRFYIQNKPRFLWVKEKKKIKVNNLFDLESKVVQIAPPHIGEKISLWPYYSNNQMINWQKDLHEFFARNKISSAIKIHPESYHEESIRLAKKQNVEVLKQKFEEISWNKQVLIFEAATTVFKTAIILDMPIVFIIFPRLKILDSTLFYMKKRCALIEGKLNSKGRLTVNWKRFSNCIKDSRVLAKNKDFKKKFFF